MRVRKRLSVMSLLAAPELLARYGVDLSTTYDKVASAVNGVPDAAMSPWVYMVAAVYIVAQTVSDWLEKKE